MRTVTGSTYELSEHLFFMCDGDGKKIVGGGLEGQLSGQE